MTMRTELNPVSDDVSILTRQHALRQDETSAGVMENDVVSFGLQIDRNTEADFRIGKTVSRSRKREVPTVAAEPISSISGTVLEFQEYGALCEVYIGGDTKYVSLQRDLLPETARIGSPISVAMVTDGGLTRFVVRERTPNAQRQLQGLQEIQNLVDSL